MIRRMLKEEWRIHSELYRGSNFATFPFVIFGISLAATYLILNYSTISASAYGGFLSIIGLFMGLTVGTIGFSSSDMLKNVFGRTNFLIYASRTLPVSRRKLLAAFLVKDLIYYSLGILVVEPGLVSSILNMLGMFLIGLPVSVLIARTSLHVKRSELFSYSDISFLEPLTSKSIIDLSRSSGGLFKILFSVGLITGFYWFTLFYFPVTQSLLQNPL
ncbi:MAG: hypothetical protein ABEJ72_01045, partial [Candidatus Aenigmatarchaeota archaeon]